MQGRIIRAGGLHSPINYPWYIAGEKLGQDIEATALQFIASSDTYTELLDDLRRGTIEVAVLPTELAVASIGDGLPAYIAGTFVSSPERWAEYRRASPTGADAPCYTEKEELGAQLLAQQLTGGFTTNSTAAPSADRLITASVRAEALTADSAWTLVAEHRNPWPAYLLVARESVRDEELHILLRRLRQSLHRMNEEQTYQFLQDRFGLSAKTARECYTSYHWMCRPRIPAASLEAVQQSLATRNGFQPRAANQLVGRACVLTDHPLSKVMYNWRVESVHRALRSRKKSCGPLQLSDLLELGHLDQYHYLGAQTSFELIDLLQLKPGERVFDIGSGVGGTSRVLAHETGCRVVALELQQELNELAEDLTERLGLSDHIQYRTEDFLQYEAEEAFDHFISLLVFLHIPQRRAVLQKCYQTLRPGGSFVIEDFMQVAPLRTDEQETLEHTVSAVTVTTAATYLRDLEACGFTDLKAADCSAAWREWTQSRYQKFVEDESQNRAFFGDEIFERRAYFYGTIRDLFAGKRLGGLRITGRRPS